MAREYDLKLGQRSGLKSSWSSGLPRWEGVASRYCVACVCVDHYSSEYLDLRQALYAMEHCIPRYRRQLMPNGQQGAAQQLGSRSRCLSTGRRCPLSPERESL